MNAQAKFRLGLFSAGDSQKSVWAITSLRALCQEHLPERHEIELGDVLRETQLAMADSMLLTPTLVKLAHEPVLKILGSLSQPEPLLATSEIGEVSK